MATFVTMYPARTGVFFDPFGGGSSSTDLVTSNPSSPAIPGMFWSLLDLIITSMSASIKATGGSSTSYSFRPRVGGADTGTISTFGPFSGDLTNHTLTSESISIGATTTLADVSSKRFGLHFTFANFGASLFYSCGLGYTTDDEHSLIGCGSSNPGPGNVTSYFPLHLIGNAGGYTTENKTQVRWPLSGVFKDFIIVIRYTNGSGADTTTVGLRINGSTVMSGVDVNTATPSLVIGTTSEIPVAAGDLVNGIVLQSSTGSIQNKTFSFITTFKPT